MEVIRFDGPKADRDAEVQNMIDWLDEQIDDVNNQVACFILTWDEFAQMAPKFSDLQNEKCVLDGVKRTVYDPYGEYTSVEVPNPGSTKEYTPSGTYKGVRIFVQAKPKMADQFMKEGE